MKIAYIAHPIGNDVPGNLTKIRAIVRKINLTEPGTVPFAPYYADCVAMVDQIPEERQRGILNDKTILASGIVDELRLYGDRISAGMRHEIETAMAEGIIIMAMTPQTQQELTALLS